MSEEMENRSPQTIKVIYCEPGRKARIAEIGTELSDLQRAVYGDDQKIQDIIFGPFFICDCSGENFGSLNPEQLDRYGHMFECPEHYVKVNGEIHAIPYEPSRSMDWAR